MASLHAAVAMLALSAAGETVMYDFYADGCAPCRAMAPTVAELAAKGYPIQKVNIAQDRALAAKYNIGPVPCFVMVVNGREVDRVVGGTTYSRLERMCRLAATAQAQPLRETAATMPAAQTMAAPPPSAQTMTTPAPLEIAGQPQGWTPRADAGGPDQSGPDADLVLASVRLRIEDPRGQSCGSGTIIDARQGEALVLTCGHIFRESRGKGPIKVDLFGPTPAQGIPAKLISYDLDRDVGLVSIRTPGPVTAARVAPPGYRLVKGMPVISVGCNNGDRPSARHSEVILVDNYKGPPNLQVAGMPVEGRSGGGVFSSDGLVIGVCNAADQDYQAGLYAALGAIHEVLDQASLSYVCQPKDDGPATGPAKKMPDAPLVAVDPPPTMSKQMPRPANDRPAPLLSETALGPAPPRRLTPEAAQPLSPPEQAALDEIHRRLQDGAEVVCVIRPRRDPQSKTEVIMLNQVSPGFLKQLGAETPAQPATAAMPATPATRQPRIEWSLETTRR